MENLKYLNLEFNCLEQFQSDVFESLCNLKKFELNNNWLIDGHVFEGLDNLNTLLLGNNLDDSLNTLIWTHLVDCVV